MIDEGYTKFIVDWTDKEPVADPMITELDRWRRRLFRAGLVGQYEDLGIGYGNISVRVAGERQFLISGTRTGHLPETTGRHYAYVTDYDIDANRVACRGATQASSESLTHAAIYELDAGIRAVVHVHDRPLWEYLQREAPTTGAEVAYGTPGMAREFARLWHATTFARTRVAAMAGHDSGIVSIGETLPEAAIRVLRLHDDLIAGQQEFT